MTAAARREQLIDTALHLFGVRGFEGTTTRAIAEAAGVSEAIIFRHFTTKQDLYDAILRQKAEADGLQQTRSAITRCVERDDDEGLVFQLALKTLEAYRRDPDFQRLLFFAALDRNELAQASHRTVGLPMFDVLRAYVVRRQAAGAFRAGDARLMALGLVALPVYYATVTRLFGIDLGRKSDREVAKAVTAMILDGLKAEGARPPASLPHGTDDDAE